MKPEPVPLILFVDDDGAIRELAVTILEAAGYEVLPGADGIEALHIYRASSRPIDLLITDIDLPGRSGIELVEVLAGSGAIGGVLLISGGINPTSVSLAGTLPFLAKPFLPDALLEAVRQVLTQTSAARVEVHSTAP